MYESNGADSDGISSKT